MVPPSNLHYFYTMKASYATYAKDRNFKEVRNFRLEVDFI